MTIIHAMHRMSFIPGVTGCRFLVVAWVVFLSGLFGCQGSSDSPDDENTDEDENGSDTPLCRLRVSGGKLLDEAGNQVVLKGLGLGTINNVKEHDKWNEAYFADARDWGATLVRLPVSPTVFRGDPDQTLQDLDDAVAWCRSQGIYLIIDYHVTGNPSQMLFHYGESTTWEDVEVFWKTVAPRYADDPTAAFAEIFNEPAALSDMGGSLTFAEWRSHADALVAILRDSAPEMIPLVAGIDFAYDFSLGGKKPFSDPDIALSVHPYPGQARENRRENWDTAFGYLSEHYPIVLTEFGFDPYDEIYPSVYLDDLPYGREILSYAEEKHISWTAFVFFNDPYWPMPLFSDWETLEPTVSGLFFKDVLTGGDIETAGSEFGERPEVIYPESNGPSDMYWSSWAGNGASVEWTAEPSAKRAGVHIEAEGAAQAGMFATFSWDGTTIDATGFNEIVIKGTVTEGEPFSVVLGRSTGHAENVFHGCSWNLTGRGEDTYAIDLLTPIWCGPDACFDMQASGIGFNNVENADGSDVNILIESVMLQRNPESPLPQSGRIGTGACQ